MFASGIWSDLSDIQDPKLKALAEHLPRMTLASRQDKTVRNYLAAFAKWKQWCSRFDEVVHLPAKPVYVALYLLELSQNAKSHSPVTLAYYSISWAHRSAGLNDPTKGDLPRMVKEASLRTLGHGDNKKEPISAQAIVNIVNKFVSHDSTLMDLRVATLCILGFTGFFRFDEMSKIKFCDILFAQSYVKIFLEKSKTDVYREGEWVYIARLSGAVCPVKVLTAYLTRAGFSGYSEQYIFRGVTRNKVESKHTLKKQNKPISYSTARTLVLQAFQSVGEDPKVLGLHSLRSGGATAAAKSAIPDRLFRKHGRWHSNMSKDRYVKEDVKQKLVVSRNLGL